ncbi:MAG: C4-dicarboxylate ABC transporter permease [Hyphomicrobiaceae bacterium TMED74]|nr:C4-dicarboxylate ABC transporter permease [Filomicrobium sp.]RPG47160.1 MAG: C4-dicarboxylate ABC transporter permease [Hyphomicrobiaceae bacterium TMED74]
MEVFSNLAYGFALVASWQSLTAALIGLAAGIVIGALPGLTATMAVAVLAPFTFFMESIIGIPFLLGIYKGAIYGGSIPAITINTPGTAAAAATALDGNALSRKGKGRLALEVSLIASVIADLIATLALIFVAAPLAAVAIKFGSPDFTMLYLFALTMIAGVSGNSIAKGTISVGLGILIACVGLDPVSGYQRLTFGSVDLLGGISLVPLLIGMFALSEIFIQAERAASSRATAAASHPDGGGVTFTTIRRLMPTILRSTGIGTLLGALPGLGAEISCWVSYGIAAKRSKEPKEFGKGSLEGVAAAEAGNNAVCPAALIPMMVFGIPGDTITAVLLGAFMAQGLLPGPLLFQQHGPVLYGFFAILLVTNIMLLVFGFGAIRYLRHITRIPPGLLYPAVTVLCFAGAFAVNNAVFDWVIMVAGGAAGYVMRKTDVPIPPLVIAMLLAPGLENNIRQSLSLSDGSYAVFVQSPIAAVLLFVTLVVFTFFVWRSLNPSPVLSQSLKGQPK